MCGRFTLTTDDYESVASALGARFDPAYAADFRARFNIAPTDAHWIVCIDEAGRREIRPATWGLPSPTPRGDGVAGTGHINARSETAHRLPAFRGAFARTRCGVIADGFYEWTGPKHDRQPCWFHTPDGSPILFAGLWRDHVDARTGEVLRRFTILTTQANALVEPYHDRMPVVLPPDTYDLWLRPAPAEALRALLVPPPDDALVPTPVSKRVNSPRFDDASCIEPRDRVQQQRLF